MELDVRRAAEAVDDALSERFEDALRASLGEGAGLPWADIRGAVDVEIASSDIEAHAPARVLTLDGELWSASEPSSRGVAVRTRASCLTPGECGEPAAAAFASAAASALRLAGSTDAEVIAALRSATGPELAPTLREAQRRLLAGACVELVDAVPRAESDDALFAAAGAAAELGCAAAVAPLINATDTRRGELLAAIVPALGVLGGAEAVGFLQAVASGHDDQRARNAARHALRGMQHATP